MKRLISAVLALSLAGSSVAMAQPFRGGGHDSRSYNSRSYSAPSRYGHSGYGYGSGYGYRNRDNGAAALGLGLFALGLFGALAASQNHDRYYDQGYSYGPPAGAYGGYGYNYGPGYGGYYGR